MATADVQDTKENLSQNTNDVTDSETTKPTLLYIREDDLIYVDGGPGIFKKVQRSGYTTQRKMVIAESRNYSIQ
jgi:hypothetical protein